MPIASGYKQVMPFMVGIDDLSYKQNVGTHYDAYRHFAYN
jgi:hypothetical protein